MKGVSAVIVIILILLITVSLAALAYIFFTGMFATTTQAGTEAIEQVETSMSAQMTIDSISGQDIHIRNIGQITLTDFTVYVNNMITTDIVQPSGGSIATKAVGRITVNTPALTSGDIVKVTCAQGAMTTKNV
jgi:FlaG/FlaF family flagellin (archaellin)